MLYDYSYEWEETKSIILVNKIAKCFFGAKDKKKPKPRDKEESKFLKEKVEVKLQHKDIAEIINILGYYKGELQSTQDYNMPTHGIDKLIDKLNKQLDEHK